jgi:ABC-type Fe3+ transport system substrate-binding protein
MRTRHRRNVEIKWLDVGGASKVLKELESRFASSPDAPGVDLMFGGGVAPFLTAIQQHWLAPLDLSPETLAGIPPMCAGTAVFDPDRRWFGVALSGFGILYNHPLVRRLNLPVPTDWADLARPEYFSWVGSGDPRSSGSVHMCYEIILQAHGFEQGWPLIARLCANVRGFGEAGGTVPREVASGDIAAGMVIDQYAQTVIQAVGRDALVFVLPGRNTVIGPDAIGMIKGSRQPGLCRLFTEYALSPEGQRLLYQPAGTAGQKFSLYRMPVLKACYAEADAPRPDPYVFPAGLVYDNDLGMRRWNVLNDLMGVWLIDAHADLRSAWQKIIARGCPSDQVAALCAPPLTGEELEALAAKWKDARHKQEVMQAWARAARERYQRLSQ